MRKVADFLDTGADVLMAMKAGDLSLLLRLAAQVADEEGESDKTSVLLKKIHQQVLPAVEK